MKSVNWFNSFLARLSPLISVNAFAPDSCKRFFACSFESPACVERVSFNASFIDSKCQSTRIGWFRVFLMYSRASAILFNSGLD
jgi:hypothetical protein